MNLNETKTTENVEVFCRLKPCTLAPDDLCVRLLSKNSLKIVAPAQKNTKHEVTCNFKRILFEADQKEVYETIADDMVTGLLEGKNGLLFTYGITGSGKTYTLGGSSRDPGILPRCMTAIYNSVKRNLTNNEIYFDKNGQIQFGQMKHQRIDATIMETPHCLRTNQEPEDLGHAYSIFISMIEIYNNNIYDLFDENIDPITKLPCSKNLRENNKTFISNLVYIPIRSVSEALTFYRKGKKRRKVAQTLLNSESSRSHCVFSIYLVQIENNDNFKSARVSSLVLCDLAGSERMYRTQNEGDRQKESSSINSSLMALRNCIEVLRENGTKKSNLLVPYRENRLTMLFRNFFEGDGLIRMIICLNPIPGDYEENLHVIRFAEVTQEVKIKNEKISQTPKIYRKANVQEISLIPFPQFPSSLMTSYDDSRVIPEIITYLHDSEKSRKTLKAELATLIESIKNEIIKLNSENSDLKDRNLSKSKYEDLERELVQIKHSLKIAKSRVAVLEEAQKKSGQEVIVLKNENDCLAQKLSNEKSARNILKKKLRDFQEYQKYQLERECNKRVLEATEEMKNQIRKHDQKIFAVKGVLQDASNLAPLSELSNVNSAVTDFKETKRKRKSSAKFTQIS